jgi:hypothetical protein
LANDKGAVMISIRVDEAYAFDMLAILQIKSTKSAQSLEDYEEFLEQINNDLGCWTANLVLQSEEYKTLLEANQKVFDLIERVVKEQEFAIPDDWVTAFTVHNANMERFYAKKALQKRFFKNNLTEHKTVK